MTAGTLITMQGGPENIPWTAAVGLTVFGLVWFACHSFFSGFTNLFMFAFTGKIATNENPEQHRLGNLLSVAVRGGILALVLAATVFVNQRAGIAAAADYRFVYMEVAMWLYMAALALLTVTNLFLDIKALQNVPGRWYTKNTMVGLSYVLLGTQAIFATGYNLSQPDLNGVELAESPLSMFLIIDTILFALYMGLHYLVVDSASTKAAAAVANLLNDPTNFPARELQVAPAPTIPSSQSVELSIGETTLFVPVNSETHRVVNSLASFMSANPNLYTRDDVAVRSLGDKHYVMSKASAHLLDNMAVPQNDGNVHTSRVVNSAAGDGFSVKAGGVVVKMFQFGNRMRSNLARLGNVEIGEEPDVAGLGGGLTVRCHHASETLILLFSVLMGINYIYIFRNISSACLFWLIMHFWVMVICLAPRKTPSTTDGPDYRSEWVFLQNAFGAAGLGVLFVSQRILPSNAQYVMDPNILNFAPVVGDFLYQEWAGSPPSVNKPELLTSLQALVYGYFAYIIVAGSLLVIKYRR